MALLDPEDVLWNCRVGEKSDCFCVGPLLSGIPWISEFLKPWACFVALVYGGGSFTFHNEEKVHHIC